MVDESMTHRITVAQHGTKAQEKPRDYQRQKEAQRSQLTQGRDRAGEAADQRLEGDYTQRNCSPE